MCFPERVPVRAYKSLFAWQSLCPWPCPSAELHLWEGTGKARTCPEVTRGDPLVHAPLGGRRRRRKDLQKSSLPLERPLCQGCCLLPGSMLLRRARFPPRFRRGQGFWQEEKKAKKANSYVLLFRKREFLRKTGADAEIRFPIARRVRGGASGCRMRGGGVARGGHDVPASHWLGRAAARRHWWRWAGAVGGRGGRGGGRPWRRAVVPLPLGAEAAGGGQRGYVRGRGGFGGVWGWGVGGGQCGGGVRGV